MTTTTTNPYCEALGIEVPRLEGVKDRPDVNSYSLLIVALLERGGPITLAEAAKRFEEAGIAPADRALGSLKRCRPARSPVYRVGDRYALDAHDDATDLWTYRLGLRPPKVASLEVVRPDPRPMPSSDRPLTVADLDEAWQNGIPSSWSPLRIAICVLDAHGEAISAESLLALLGRAASG